MSNRVIRGLSDRHLQAQLKSKKKRDVPIGLDRFNTVRSTRLDLLKPRSASKTKNLIKFLLGHSSRAQRATLPKKHMRLRVKGPNGVSAVKLSFR